jgi:putative N6-adenine-specific DNA methylase
MPTRHSFFAACPPGLETILQTELFALGINHPQSVPGGVEFSGFLSHLYRVNLWSRTASRVLVRLGEFEAKSFQELKRKTADLLWGQFLKPNTAIHVRATCHKSKLYHSDAVAERVGEAINDCLHSPLPSAKLPMAEGAGVRVVVRLDHDHCTLSLDSSGDHLHQRGYRLATAKAPLRETLAAALLLCAHYDPTQSFLDPFCGSGTFAIEAALIARNVAPGINRRFAFMDWLSFDADEWYQLILDARAARRATTPAPILASDRDAGAVAATIDNAARAGVADSLQITAHSVSDIQPPGDRGLIVTNLPYGQRVGEDVRNVYARFGSVLREKCPGWRVGFLAGSLALVKQTRLAVGEPVWIENGGLKVPFVQASL